MSIPDFRYKQNRLQQLRGFCYAAQAGSISKAAKRLFLSQPSVSLQIKALERELECVLFERRGPKIRLTPDGEALLELALPMVESMDSLEEEFAARRNMPEHGRLDIAAGQSTILYILPKYVEKFVTDYPAIDLRLHSVTGRQGMEQLRAGEVDFAFGPMLQSYEDIVYFPVFSYDTVLITALGHPLTKKKHVTIKDISAYPLILPPRELTTYRIVDAVFRRHNLPYEVKLEAGGYEVIKKYVGMGLGVSIVSSVCVSDAYSPKRGRHPGGRDKLAVIPVGRHFPKRTYGVVLRRGKVLSPQSKRFIKLMDPTIKDL